MLVCTLTQSVRLFCLFVCFSAKFPIFVFPHGVAWGGMITQGGFFLLLLKRLQFEDIHLICLLWNAFYFVPHPLRCIRKTSLYSQYGPGLMIAATQNSFSVHVGMLVLFEDKLEKYWIISQFHGCVFLSVFMYIINS